MQIYRDVDGDSGVAAYDIGPDYIRVRFKDDAIYLYNYESAGISKVEQMKKLAACGDGLNAFINTHVLKGYYRRER
jgi:hypothetical protein